MNILSRRTENGVMKNIVSFQNRLAELRPDLFAVENKIEVDTADKQVRKTRISFKDVRNAAYQDRHFK